MFDAVTTSYVRSDAVALSATAQTTTWSVRRFNRRSIKLPVILCALAEAIWADQCSFFSLTAPPVTIEAIPSAVILSDVVHCAYLVRRNVCQGRDREQILWESKDTMHGRLRDGASHNAIMHVVIFRIGGTRAVACCCLARRRRKHATWLQCPIPMVLISSAAAHPAFLALGMVATAEYDYYDYDDDYYEY